MSNSLQNKMFHYEVPPPEGTWEKLASRLGEHQEFSFASRLYHFEETPAKNTWNRILSHLNKSNERTETIPFFTRYRRPLKYTSAIAALFILAVLGSLLISKKTESEVPSRNIAGTPTTQQPVSQQPSIENEPGDTRKNDHANIASAVTKALHDRKSATARTYENELSPGLSLAGSFIPRVAERSAVIDFSLPTDQYMIYSDAEGHVMRLPKRLYDAVACPDHQEDCRQKFRSLQQKVASSIMASDLAGMLEMLNGLPENQ